MRRRLVAALAAVPFLALLVAAVVAYRSERVEPATWYAHAESALAVGDFARAADAFAAARGLRDAEARRAEVVAFLAPYRAAAVDATTALDAGRPEDAIALLLPVVRDLPRDAASVALLAEARRQRKDALGHEVDAATAAGDWLVAERALVELVALVPDDDALADRLAAFRRAHAPLVVARDRTLRLLGPDGEDDRLLLDEVPAAWPAWSPDRARLAFVSEDEGDLGNLRLLVAEADGTGARSLADGLRSYASPVWSPDGRRIAYSVEPNATTGGAVRVVEVATGRALDLPALSVPNAVSPTWSPTGDRLAFVSRALDSAPPTTAATSGNGDAPQTDEVYVFTFATGELINLGAGRVLHPWRVAWSPVDDRVLVYTRAPGTSYDRDRARLALIDARTGALTDITTANQAITMPVWSPDGQRLVYVAGESTVRVHALSGGTSAVIPLPDPISRHLTWSPDGDALLAVAASPNDASVLIPFASGVAGNPAPFPLDYDFDRRLSGAPQWSALNPAAPPLAPSVDGTALDS